MSSVDPSKEVTMTDSRGGTILNRSAFDFQKSRKIKYELIYRASALCLLALISIGMIGYTSVYISEWLDSKDFSRNLYYSLIVILVLSTVNLIIIIILFGLIPYEKIKGILLLVKSMINIFGADYADPDIHKSMGTLLAKDQKNAVATQSYLEKMSGNVGSEMIRSFNPSIYGGTSVGLQDIRQGIQRQQEVRSLQLRARQAGEKQGQPNAVDANGNSITATPLVPVTGPMTTLANINVGGGNSSPKNSVIFQNPIYDTSVASQNPIYSNPPVGQTITTYPPPNITQVSSNIPPPVPTAYDRIPLYNSNNNIRRSTTPEITQEDYDTPSVYSNDLQDRRDAGEAAANANQPTNQQ